MSPTTSKKHKFSVGEKILCYQGHHIYDAKCLKMKEIGSTVKYLVHYCNFKSKFDEWVTPDRMLKHNKDNLAIQERLKSKSSKKSNKKKDKLSENKDKKLKLEKKPNVNSSVNSILKEFKTEEIVTPPFVESAIEFLEKKELKIMIPDDLNIVLTDDWEFITTQNKLIYLPSNTNIDKILNDYFLYKTSKLTDKNVINTYTEFLFGIRKYFNFLLDKCLLYDAEKAQLEYLVNNYDNLTLVVNTEANCTKDSKRVSKKQKKNSNSKKIDQANQLSFDEFTPNNVSECFSKNTNDDNSSKDNILNSESSNSLTECKQQSENPNLKTRKVHYTKLYGAVHLLRLFSKLGQFLFYTDLTADRLANFNTYIKDFLNYLVKNLSLFYNDVDTSYLDANLFNFENKTIEDK